MGARWGARLEARGEGGGQHGGKVVQRAEARSRWLSCRGVIRHKLAMEAWPLPVSHGKSNVQVAVFGVNMQRVCKYYRFQHHIASYSMDELRGVVRGLMARGGNALAMACCEKDVGFCIAMVGC